MQHTNIFYETLMTLYELSSMIITPIKFICGAEIITNTNKVRLVLVTE